MGYAPMASGDTELHEEHLRGVRGDEKKAGRAANQRLTEQLKARLDTGISKERALSGRPPAELLPVWEELEKTGREMLALPDECMSAALRGPLAARVAEWEGSATRARGGPAAPTRKA